MSSLQLPLKKRRLASKVCADRGIRILQLPSDLSALCLTFLPTRDLGCGLRVSHKFAKQIHLACKRSSTTVFRSFKYAEARFLTENYKPQTLRHLDIGEVDLTLLKHGIQSSLEKFPQIEALQMGVLCDRYEIHNRIGMGFITKQFRHLEELVLTVTDTVGLRTSFEVQETAQTCQKIRKLQIWNGVVTELDFLNIVSNLPLLEVLSVYYVRFHPNEVLQDLEHPLKNLRRLQLGFPYDSGFADVARIFPNIQELYLTTLCQFKVKYLDELATLKDLDKLAIAFYPFLRYGPFTYFKIGSNVIQRLSDMTLFPKLSSCKLHTGTPEAFEQLLAARPNVMMYLGTDEKEFKMRV